MMLVDANVLLFAVDARGPFYARARARLTERLNGSQRVGLPWQSLLAFLQIATHPRASERPMAPADAWERDTDWLASPVAWVPVCSADTDFARFPEIRWENPLAVRA